MILGPKEHKSQDLRIYHKVLGQRSWDLGYHGSQVPGGVHPCCNMLMLIWQTIIILSVPIRSNHHLYTAFCHLLNFKTWW